MVVKNLQDSALKMKDQISKNKKYVNEDDKYTTPVNNLVAKLEELSTRLA
jgi:hypothetical protein